MTLENQIQAYLGIPDAHLKTIEDLFEHTLLPKGENYTTTGSFHANLSFIKSGYLRVYETKDDKEITQWISSPGEFITDLGTLVFDAPARRNIQAITDCELYTISRENYRRIGGLIPEWPELEKRFLAKCFMILEDRVFNFISMSSEERYEQLFAYKRELFNQVPLQYIASMLGMTPETLSRIRKKSIS
ncbi:cAMP-binding protein [Owenweeksia hongkongensis DSM 17368]|uniref:cAMP-binding protein n=1 Tax=Owenweeksia hongkongensis (strain DSM 17368 / CIP 108786 / JCM 12287 / NRRL B-23963 / UST20020801) TaxID=926562 RepID=G8R1L6_OWEHD|nr:Crp/Fnr family transcriptional regulator [Owenweeksia hongkongensis]AEV31755.1 cAMP-binding protein [Owenweeksia hongkongensis DSM 17368]